jgi:hypothetical protein
MQVMARWRGCLMSPMLLTLGPVAHMKRGQILEAGAVCQEVSGEAERWEEVESITGRHKEGP